MKISLEFEKIPAVGVLFGYDKNAGFIIMLPFFSKINTLKVNKNVEHVAKKW